MCCILKRAVVPTPFSSCRCKYPQINAETPIFCDRRQKMTNVVNGQIFIDQTVNWFSRISLFFNLFILFMHYYLLIKLVWKMMKSAW